MPQLQNHFLVVLFDIAILIFFCCVIKKRIWPNLSTANTVVCLLFLYCTIQAITHLGFLTMQFVSSYKIISTLENNYDIVLTEKSTSQLEFDKTIANIRSWENVLTMVFESALACSVAIITAVQILRAASVTTSKPKKMGCYALLMFCGITGLVVTIFAIFRYLQLMTAFAEGITSVAFGIALLAISFVADYMFFRNMLSNRRLQVDFLEWVRQLNAELDELRSPIKSPTTRSSSYNTPCFSNTLPGPPKYIASKGQKIKQTDPDMKRVGHICCQKVKMLYIKTTNWCKEFGTKCGGINRPLVCVMLLSLTDLAILCWMVAHLYCHIQEDDDTRRCNNTANYVLFYAKVIDFAQFYVFVSINDIMTKWIHSRLEDTVENLHKRNP